MKNNTHLDNTINHYKRAGYPAKTIAHLEYLESRCERLDRFLELYRYLQPEEGLLLEKTIEIIVRLQELDEEVSHKEENLDILKQSIDELYQEIAYLENGMKLHPIFTETRVEDSF